MISSTESIIKRNLKNVLDYLLSSQNVLENQILSDLPKDIKQPFIETFSKYGGHKGIDIPVYDTFPQTPPENGAFFLVQFEGSEEDLDSSSISQQLGDWSDNAEGDIYEDTQLPIKTETLDNGMKQAYVELPTDSYQIQGIKQLSDYTLETPNKIVFAYNPMYDKQQLYLDVTYSKLNKVTGKSIPVGVSMIEKVAIDFVSPNISVLKCLYAVMLYVQAYLKQSIELNHNLFLPTFSFQGNDVISTLSQENATESMYLYYRRLEIIVHSTQTMDLPATKTLDDFILDMN